MVKNPPGARALRARKTADIPERKNRKHRFVIVALTRRCSLDSRCMALPSFDISDGIETFRI
jgi:hypothetical protein